MSARVQKLLISDDTSPNFNSFGHGDVICWVRHVLALGVRRNIGPNPFQIEYWVLTTPIQVPVRVYHVKSPKSKISARKSDCW